MPASCCTDDGDLTALWVACDLLEENECFHESSCHSGCVTCNLCPCRYGFVEGLIFDRNNRSANRPVVLDLNTNEVLLTTGDLNFDIGGGIRAIVGERLHDAWALELGYLGVFDQSTAAYVSRTDSLRLPGDLGLAVNNFFAADRVDVHYESRLHSAEANLVHCCTIADECSNVRQSREWFAGFRYLYLGEQIDVVSFDSAESTSTYTAQTENNLFGGQLGARWRRCREKWSLESTCKVGLFGSAVRQTQAPIIDFPGFVFRTARSGSDTDVAFVGEINLTGIYQLNPVWGLRAGYNLLWIEGVSLAPDQLDFTNTSTSGAGLVGGSSVFYHGVNVGLEARW